ncbi:MAG: PQQ-binding-like beta-propeller repeat protein [Phycisphaerales bacterium]|nr:PQQ-binding-like beta-propeller repeat protein [Phycisphaerales bacterium]
MGELSAARAALEQTQSLPDAGQREPHVQAVQEIITQLALTPMERSKPPVGGYFGSLISKQGQAASAMGDAVKDDDASVAGGRRVWLRLWTDEHELSAPPVPGEEQVRYSNQSFQHRGQLVSRWEKMQWKPTAQAVGDGRLLVFRTHRSLRALDVASGQVAWESLEPEPRFWANAGQYTMGFIQRDNDRIVPTHPEEILFFGDRLNRAVRLMDQTIYTIEAQVQAAGLGQPLRMFPGRMPATLPPNTLAAYDLSTGNVLWRKDSFDLSNTDAPTPGAEPLPPAVPLPMKVNPAPGNRRGNPPAPPPSPYRFIGLPVKVHDQLVVAAEKEDELALVWLSAVDGQLIRLVDLCQGPLGGGADWSPVGLAVQDDRIFVATGRGVVLAVDAMDGALLWASRYTRPLRIADRLNPLGGYRDISPAPMGWDDDLVLLSGSMLVVTSSDSHHLLALDAQQVR